MPTFTVSIPGGRIGHFLAGAAVASVIGGTAIAVTSPDFTYSGVKAGNFTIDPMALAPSASTIDFNINYSGADGGYLASGTGCFQTGVNLPNGSTVASVTTAYRSGNTSNPTIVFYRHNLATGGAAILIQAPVLDDSNQRKSITHPIPASLRTIDNSAFAYGYGYCVNGDGTRFFNARVNYTYKTAGD